MMQQEERELTQQEIDQQDKLEGLCYKLISDLVEQQVDWNQEWIGELADAVTDIVCNQLKLAKEPEFYPYTQMSRPDQKQKEDK